MEGIRKAKAAGRYKGRPATVDIGEIARLKAEGLGAIAIAKQLNIARSSVYRVLGDNRTHVRFPPRLGHNSDITRCLRCAKKFAL